MAKTFAARVSKKKREKKDITAHLDQKIFEMNDLGENQWISEVS